MTSISRFVNNLYCRYTLHEKLNLNLQEPDCPFVSLCMLKSFFHLLSFFFFSFFEPLFVIPCHLLYYLLSLILICCHSLLFVVNCSHLLFLVVPRCHSLHRWLPLVVTGHTTRLPFYKRSLFIRYEVAADKNIRRKLK